MSTDNKVKAVLEVCAALSAGDTAQARKIILSQYPHDKTFRKGVKACRVFSENSRKKSMFTAKPIILETRNKEQQRLAIFVRDGFIDRYFGDKLIFNGTLRVISYVMPDIFPYQSHGKTQLSHQAWWDLSPSVSHITPTEIEGSDDTENLVCASTRRNFQKLDATPEEVGWQFLPPGNLDDWDGLLHWFIEYVNKNPDVKENNYINNCYKACTALKLV